MRKFTEPVIRNNIIVQNSSYGISINGDLGAHGYNNIWNNAFGSYSGIVPGSGDIHRNPIFAVDGYWDNYTWIDGDYHLQSGAGRWTETGWVINGANSSCIDAGNPEDDFSDEPQPNGGRINMGAYGGTAYASKTPNTGITAPSIPRSLTVQGGHKQLALTWQDPNDDGGLPITTYRIYRGPAADALTFHTEVDGGELSYTDANVQNGNTYFYAVSAVNGFGQGEICPAVQAQAEWHALDINGDGVIDMVDFALFCREWLWQAWWHE